MRVMVLATRDPAGPQTGRKAVLRTIVSSLVTLGHDVDLAVIAHRRPSILDEPTPGVRVHRLEPPSTTRIVANLVTRAIPHRQSLNECLYDSPVLRQRVRELAHRCRTEVVVADMIRTAELAFAVGVPVVLDLDDLLSERYRRIARGNADVSTLLGYHRENLHPLVARGGSWVARRAIGWEAGMLGRRELECARRATVVSLVSPAEREQFETRLGRTVECLPMAIDGPRLPATVRHNPPTLLLTAKLDYGPNLDALRWYRRDVLPHLRGTGLRLDVVGACPPSVRRELESESLRFLGYVDDLWRLLSGGRAFVAPIVSGSGVKTKVLEAMAAGLPVVSTSRGVQGLDAEHGRNCLIADSGPAFAEMVTLVAEDRGLAESIGAAGRILAAQTYSPAIVRDRWEAVLAPLGSTRGDAPAPMRTVVVTKFVPLPANSGGKQRSLATLRRLRELGPTVLCAFDDGGADIAGLERMGIDVRAVPWKRGPRTTARDLTRGVLSTASVTASRFASHELATAVDAALHEAPTDLLYVNYAQLSPYARGRDARCRVLDLHNIESALVRSYAKSSGRLHSIAARVEALALGRLERRAMSEFDTVVVVSDADRARLPAVHPRVLVCPNGCDTMPPLAPADRPVATFIALLGWRPNVEAAEWLVRDIWPLVRQRVPQAELLLVGRDPSPAVRALAGSGISVTGSVPSVRPFLASSRLGLAPLRAGGGSRLKILESLDAGRPVVATTIGAEGLEDLVGRGIVVADGAREMADAIARLLDDPAEADRLGRAGRAAVAQAYSWDATLAPMLEHVQARP